MKTKPAPANNFQTVKHVADRLAVSERSVRRWIADGELEAVKLGRNVRIPEDAVERLIRRNFR